MNNGINEQAIEKYLSSTGRTISQNYVYAYVMPSDLDSFLLGELSVVNLENFIIVFYENEILLVPLTLNGDFDTNQQPIVIEKSIIDDIKIKKGLLQYKINIITSKGSLKLNCTKKILSNPWQSNNIKNLEANNWFR